jgi:MDMPI C-terminal domain/Mycothiol maleylpyruvate isomerase N-terminal domain
VADVIAHLAGGNRSHAAWITEALHAKNISTEPLPRRSHHCIDAVALAHRVMALRHELGPHLLSAFVTSARALEHAFAQVGPDDWETLCYRPNGAEPLRTILDNFIAEVGVHRWDVMVPFDPHVQLSPEGVAVMVERYPHRPRWWDIALPPQHPPLPVRFRFTVSGVTAPGTDFVVVTPEEQYMEVAGAVPAQVTFHCDAQTFVLLAYGRLSPASARATGRLTSEGSQAWAEMFLQAYIGG